MDWRVLVGTFGLIFLAELGDKTQLTALAFSAGSRSTWSVFVGASLALVCSTLVAVLLGSLMRDQSLIPMSWIKMVAGLLFLVFGVVTLREAFAAPAPAEEAFGAEATLGEGLLASAVLSSAAAFESASLARYEALSEAATHQGLARLWRHLAEEEAAHLDHLTGLDTRHAAEDIDIAREAVAATVDLDAELPASDDEWALVGQLITEETATVRFYEQLAQASAIAELRRTFRFLAAEERSHVAHLQAVLDEGHPATDCEL